MPSLSQPHHAADAGPSQPQLSALSLQGEDGAEQEEDQTGEEEEEGEEYRLPRRLSIIYATETGTAEDVAHRLARVARRRRIAVQVMDVQHYDAVSGCAAEQARSLPGWPSCSRSSPIRLPADHLACAHHAPRP